MVSWGGQGSSGIGGVVSWGGQGSSGVVSGVLRELFESYDLWEVLENIGMTVRWSKQHKHADCGTPFVYKYSILNFKTFFGQSFGLDSRIRSVGKT